MGRTPASPQPVARGAKLPGPAGVGRWRTCSTTSLAVLHDPDYREANAGALRMEWPRIPLPGWPDELCAGGR